MKTKQKNLQPWLEYFQMLHVYGQKGLLEMMPAKHEAYITQSALHTITGASGKQKLTELYSSVINTVRRIRTYAAWLSAADDDYVMQPFALHVVKEEEPHDLLYTILIERRRKWWSLWSKTDTIDVITYQDEKHG